MSGLRDELLAIRNRRGYLDPDVVVEDATPKDHPLHNRFEWNNRVAGHAYRRIQASELIRSCEVTYTRGNGTQGKIREFHAVPAPDTGRTVYDPLDEIIQSPLSTEILLRQMQRDWEAMRSRYEGLAEFRDLVAEYIQDQAA